MQFCILSLVDCGVRRQLNIRNSRDTGKQMGVGLGSAGSRIAGAKWRKWEKLYNIAKYFSAEKAPKVCMSY